MCIRDRYISRRLWLTRNVMKILHLTASEQRSQLLSADVVVWVCWLTVQKVVTRCLVLEYRDNTVPWPGMSPTRAGKGPAAPYSAGLSVVLLPGHASSTPGNSWRQIPLDMEKHLARTPNHSTDSLPVCWGSKAGRKRAHWIHALHALWILQKQISKTSQGLPSLGLSVILFSFTG